MKKKIIFTILVIYLFSILASPTVFAEQKIQTSGFFNSEISFEFTENLTFQPINPLQTQEVEIKVKFKLDMGSIAKWFFFNRRIGRLILFGPGYFLKIKGQPKATLNLTLDYPEELCTAALDTNTLTFEYDNTFKEATTKLTFNVNENAKALEKGDIKIQADFMGHWTIKGASNSTNVSFLVAYVPNILVEAESEFTIPPLQNTTIPINITNNGNGDSTILFNYVTPENWTTSFNEEDFVLKVNETKQIILTVNPPKEFTNQTINFSFTPRSTPGLYEGKPVILNINFINDGSLEEEVGKDVLIVGIIILIIIILLIITLLFLRKKKE